MSLLALVHHTLTITPRHWPAGARLLWRWGPLLFWLALIFILSHQAKENIPSAGSWDLLVKKGAHFFAYALLWLLARRAGFFTWAAFAVAVAYALGDELHQLLIPGRNGTAADVLLDSAGALTALLLSAGWQRRRPDSLGERLRR